MTTIALYIEDHQDIDGYTQRVIDAGYSFKMLKPINIQELLESVKNFACKGA